MVDENQEAQPADDQRQRDEEARAAVDQERAQADEDAGRFAIGLMHGDDEGES